MKNLFLVVIILFFYKDSDAQKIISFDCLRVREDSNSLTYSFKVEFDLFVADRDKRSNLFKIELEKNYPIKPDKIISIESFMDKRPRTFRYRVKVLKE